MKDQRPISRMWNIYKKGGGLTNAISSVFNNQNAQQVAFIRSVMKEQRKKSLLETPLRELEVVVFDLETTGFCPAGGDEIISIGAVPVVGDQLQSDEILYSLVNPKRAIPEEIQRLTGISDEMMLDAPELIDALGQFLDFVKRRILIAHGTSHDKEFLNTALWRTTRTTLTHRVLDTIMIAKWLHPQRDSYDLDSLLDAYDIPIAGRHNALEDARMTALLWSRFIQDTPARQVTTLGDLYAYLSRR